MAEKKATKNPTTKKAANKPQETKNPTTTATAQATAPKNNGETKKVGKNSFKGYSTFKTKDQTIINFSHLPSEETLAAVKKANPTAKIYLPNGSEVK